MEEIFKEALENIKQRAEEIMEENEEEGLKWK